MGRRRAIGRRAWVLAWVCAVPACASTVADSHADGSGSASGAVTTAGAGATAGTVATAGVATAGAGEPDEELPPPPAFGWCDAQPILVEKCGRCHGDPAQNGAPFALTEYADTQQLDSRGKPRYERMQAAIESDFMPAQFITLEPPVAPLTESERQQLLDWLVAGAPLGEREPADCAATP